MTKRGQVVLKAGMVTSIGSLPHRDADAAAAFVLRQHPDLPAAPQLPRRSPLEGMIAQAARGIGGVTVRADGSLSIDGDELDPTHAAAALDSHSHAGLLAFLATSAGRSGAVKVQLTGPVTLGLALADAGVRPDEAFLAAAAAVRVTATALVTLVRRRLADAPLVLFLDEPWLTRAGELPFGVDATIDLLSSALAAVENDVVTGVHCCGPAEWRLASAAGATVLSMPVERVWALSNAAAISAHLERGGWVAWGGVPTSEPVGTDVERLWRRLTGVWSDLAGSGCDPMLLRQRALVTPACGLAGHGVSQAARALRLAGQLGNRVADLAAGARRSAPA